MQEECSFLPKKRTKNLVTQKTRFYISVFVLVLEYAFSLNRISYSIS